MDKNEYHPLYAGGSFILGQEHDGRYKKEFFNPKFDKVQSFSGKITQVEIWNIILTSEEIQDLAECNISTLRPENRVVTWEDTPYWLPNHAVFKDVPIKNLCHKNPISNQFIWPRLSTFEEFNNYCEVMDARIPIIWENSHAMKLYENVLNIFKSVNSTFPTAFLDTARESGFRCFTETGHTDFWLGNKRVFEKNVWYHPYFNETIPNFELEFETDSQKCAYIDAGVLKGSNCNYKEYPCGICKVSLDHILYLKGLFKDEIELYDTKYYVYGAKNNRPYLK